MIVLIPNVIVVGLSFLVTDSSCRVIGSSLHVHVIDLTFHVTALAYAKDLFKRH